MLYPTGPEQCLEVVFRRSSMTAVKFTRAITAGVVCVFVCPAGAFATARQSDIPQFAPNANVGWVAFAPSWIAPAEGPGPVTDDPEHPRVGNDEFRASGAQPTFPVADLSSPI